MFSPFQNCWDRVARAEVHRQALITIWNGFNQDEVYASSGHIRDDGTGEFFIRTVKRDHILPLSLQLGEMLYQLRSALDSCVYDAAVLHFKQDPPPDKEKWEFKIASDPAKFGELVGRIKKLPDEIRKLMESVQPYAGMTCRFDGLAFDLGIALAMLNDWARIDRHRRLHLVGTAITDGNLRIILPPGMTLEYCEFTTEEHLLEHDHQIARFKIGNFVPGSKVNMNPRFTFEVTIDETPRVRLQEAALAMGMAITAVREIFERHYGIER